MSNWNPSKEQLIMFPAIVLKILGDVEKHHLVSTYLGIASIYGSKNKKIKRPFPSHSYLGDRNGKSKEAVKRNTYELSRLKDNDGIPLLKIINRKNKRNKKVNTSNEYVLPHYEIIYLRGLNNHTSGNQIPDPEVIDDHRVGYSDTQYLNTLSKSNYPKYTYPNNDSELMQDLIKSLSNEKSM